MKFINTKDLICGREISLNLQGVDITYIEKVGPKVSVVHFANGGVVKVPLSKDYIVSQLMEANSPNFMMMGSPLFQPMLNREDLEVKQMIREGEALMAGGDRRKGADRRTSALEKHPEKPPGKPLKSEE